jgi:HK97 gp10 family phage protein
MSKNITVTVEGVGQTVRAIGMFDMKLRQDLINTIKNTAKTIQKTGKANAPVAKTPVSRGAPGDLKRSIRPRYFDQGLSATVVPRKPKGAHRHLVEYGTGQRSTRSGANRGKMPAMPFMGPAESSADAAYNSEIRRLLDRDETV